MRILCLLAFVTLVSAEFKKLKVEHCGGDGSVIIRNIDISPMPIRIPGKLNIALDGSVTREIAGKIEVKVRMYTKTWMLGWVKFPLCVARVGSCDYDICEVLNELEARGCPKEELAEVGIQIPRCTCPVPAADIAVAFKDIDLPPIPKAFSMFAAGDYKAEGRAYVDGKEAACFRVYVSLA